LRLVGHLTRFVLAAVCAAPIDGILDGILYGILLATERRRLRVQDWLAATASCLWYVLAVVCLRGVA
jgi:hypothetical protein